MSTRWDFLTILYKYMCIGPFRHQRRVEMAHCAVSTPWLVTWPQWGFLHFRKFDNILQYTQTLKEI